MPYFIFSTDLDGTERILGSASDKDEAQEIAEFHDSCNPDDISWINEFHQLDEVWPIIKRKSEGIDCTQEESEIVIKFIPFAEEYIRKLFPTETEQFLKELDKKLQELNNKSTNRYINPTQGIQDESK